MNAIRKIGNLYYSAAALVTLAVLDATPSRAQALSGDTIGARLNSSGGEMKSYGMFIMVLSFLVGFFMFYQGIMFWKKSHMDDGRTPALRGGLFIGLGALAMGLGYVVGIVTGTLGFTNLSPSSVGSVRPF